MESLLDSGKMSKLLDLDELRQDYLAGKTFHMFTEGRMMFKPTFKVRRRRRVGGWVGWLSRKLAVY